MEADQISCNQLWPNLPDPIGREYMILAGALKKRLEKRIKHETGEILWHLNHRRSKGPNGRFLPVESLEDLLEMLQENGELANISDTLLDRLRSCIEDRRRLLGYYQYNDDE